MNMGIRIGIGVAVVAVAAGGGYLYATKAATDHAEKVLADVRSGLPDGAVLTVDDLKASPFGSATISGFSITEDGVTLTGGPASFSGSEDRVDTVALSDLALKGGDVDFTMDALVLNGMTHPDYGSLTRVLQGKVDSYDEQVKVLSDLSVDELSLSGTKIDDMTVLTNDKVVLANLRKGTLGSLTVTNTAFKDHDVDATIGHMMVADWELAEALAATMNGATGEELMAVTRHGAFDVADVSVSEDGKQVFTLKSVKLENPVYVGDQLMGGTFTVDTLSVDPRESLPSRDLETFREVLGPAADRPIEISGRAVSAYDGNTYSVSDLRFEARDLGVFEMSGSVTDYILDEASVSGVPPYMAQEAVFEAMLNAKPTDTRVHVSHSGWLHEALRRDAGSEEAAEQQAMTLGMLVAFGAGTLVGEEGAMALAEGISGFLTEKTELTFDMKNTKGLTVNEIMSSGGESGVTLAVEAR